MAFRHLTFNLPSVVSVCTKATWAVVADTSAIALDKAYACDEVFVDIDSDLANLLSSQDHTVGSVAIITTFYFKDLLLYIAL